MKKILIIPLCAFLLSCTLGSSKIVYGEQSCHFCRMTIVDKQHAAQFVNDKGKTYNFDAAECLVNYLNGVDEESIGMLLVTDYNEPESLIDATSATFIISEDMPSPMGANLSATSNKEEADGLLQNKTGELYTWDELLVYFKEM
ncbi:nitrous oxide reductase accessory protein NosL [Aureitalea sp. L0-47]|uniref:nitrous oxide reductase accessory protein NosL n=1 Tax=Aureitalea sp. L0-47 TaxID=2816962 RepID=UPI0022381874|nr:nitrous oxide reductase accessory protein NosL [Aureitalea sp. L0-47]MCW5518585.1 nitrous oxide reductase accessory protein NosL [Aureitalea sp. L0-47]